MSERLENALVELREASEGTSKFLSSMAANAERLSKKTTATLFGTFGGLIGMLLAYIINLFVPGSLAVLLALLSSIGVVTGLLAHRGKRRIALERKIEENRIAADEILARIRQLPRNAPADVRNDLWTAYRSLTSGFNEQASRTLNDARPRTEIDSPTQQVREPERTRLIDLRED